MSSIKVYRVLTATASSPHSFVTGTTATSTSNLPEDKGVTVIFQNQSTGATDVYIGPSGFALSMGATSTTGAGGIKIAQNGVYQIQPRHAPTAIHMNDFYVASTSSNGICVAQLVKAV